MKNITRSVLEEKVERLKELTGNKDLCIQYCNRRYGLYEELNTCYCRVLGSSGYIDMTNKEMYIYLDGLIAGLTYTKILTKKHDKLA